MPRNLGQGIVKGIRIRLPGRKSVTPPDEPFGAVPLGFAHVLNELHLVPLVLEAPHARPRDPRKHRVHRAVGWLHRQVDRIPSRLQIEGLDRIGIATHRQLTQSLQHHHQCRLARHLARRVLHHAVVLHHAIWRHLGVRYHQGVRRLPAHRRRRCRRSAGGHRTVRDRPVSVVPSVGRRVRTRSVSLYHHLQAHSCTHQYVYIQRLLRDHRRLHQPHRRGHRRHGPIAARRHQYRVVTHVRQPDTRHSVRRRRRSRNRLTIQKPLVAQRNSIRPTGHHSQRHRCSYHLYRRQRLRANDRRRPRQPHRDLRRHNASNAVDQARLVAARITIQQSSNRQAASAHAPTRSIRHAELNPILAPHHRAHRAGYFQRQAHRATNLS